MSQLIMQKPEQHFQNSYQNNSPTMFSQGSHQQTQLSSSLTMLPDDHWNDIEIISFGLNDTHLSHQNNVISADVNGSLIHYAASNNYLDLLQKLITTDKTEIDLLDQVQFVIIFICYISNIFYLGEKYTSSFSFISWKQQHCQVFT